MIRTPHGATLLALFALGLAGCGGTPRRAAAPPARPEGPARPAEQQPATVGPAARPGDDQLLALPDAVPATEPRARLGNPAFYEVYGQRYTVLGTARGFVERGVASWYGPDFHGVHTSTGEPYDMYSMTAAHRTLPLPAYARVTNLSNGRAVTVRINDRGPFKSNRIIDLSYAAALKLDMVRAGTTMVEVQALEPGGTAPPEPPRAVVLYAQVGAFAVQSNALRLRERLAEAGIGPLLVSGQLDGGRTLYRVRVGPIDSVAAYDELVERLHSNGVAAVTLAPD